jgi:hypothetical protein
MQARKFSLILASVVITSCSPKEGQPIAKQDPQAAQQPATEAAAKTRDGKAEITLRALYRVPAGNPPQGGLLISEYQNTGPAAISAFKGKWDLVDDLGDRLVDNEVRYTSDTLYVGETDAKGPHTIVPGETIMLVDSSINGEQRSFGTFKEAALKYVQFISQVKDAKLEDFAVTKKCTFTLEKVVSP